VCDGMTRQIIDKKGIIDVIWLRVWFGGFFLLIGLFFVLDIYDILKFERAFLLIVICVVIYIFLAYIFFHKIYRLKK